MNWLKWLVRRQVPKEQCDRTLAWMEREGYLKPHSPGPTRAQDAKLRKELNAMSLFHEAFVFGPSKNRNYDSDGRRQ